MNSENISNNTMAHTLKYPVKTVWSVFWFTILGAAAFLGNIYFLGNQWQPQNTSISHAGLFTQSTSPTMETDAEYLFKSEKITEPHQRIEFAHEADIAQFALALRDLAYGNRTKPVRILHYGDSILTTDELSGRVRYVLQRKFGDAGHGFVLLAKPWLWYHHLGIEQGATLEKWNIRPFTSGPLKDGLYGLGGVAFVAQRGKNAKAWVQTAPEGDQGRLVRWFDISYLEQPGGGSFDIYTDAVKRETVQTNGPQKKIKHVKIKVKLGKSRLRIVANNDGVLRLYGVILENGEPGIVYDSLAVNGARATALARFNARQWQEEIKYRDPSLVILMMGANEGANKFLNLKQYKQDLAKILATVKATGGQASCLVVGPLDQATKKPEGGLGSKKMPSKLNVAQREVAFSSGCAFFDTYQAMGGEGSMARWVTTGLGGGDFIHPTKSGAQSIGNWLAEALLHAYQSYGKK